MIRKDFNPIFRTVCLMLMVIISCVLTAHGKRTDDVVILKNGDRLTGEIKGLRNGELRFKASYMAEAVRLDWAEVERLESGDQYLVYLTDGQLFTDYMRLVPVAGNGDNSFVIGKTTNALSVKQLEVLRIVPVEANFWRQLEGNIDFGASFNSGNNQYQTELNAAVTYRKEEHSVTTSIDSVFSGQPKGTSTARNQFSLDYRKQLSPKWYVGGLFDLLQSDQQSLDLRTTVGGIIGRNLKQTESTRISVFGGLAATRERYTVESGPLRTSNIDAIAGIDFATFRFTTTDVTSRFVVYPSLTDPGRVRMQLKSDLRIKLAKDFYWGFHLYENFDSKPPVNAEKNDLGISASLGWKF